MKPNSRKHDADAPNLIVSVCGGVADVLFKPQGAAVTIYDYDVQGCDETDGRISKDPDGANCCICTWSASEETIINEHWPLAVRPDCSSR